ncbi:hypothetical protein B6G06_02725 [Actinomyces gaoshouyii]|nr:hypothetical protein B6G06_02725 [Actinomyces gaoshouyii]
MIMASESQMSAVPRPALLRSGERRAPGDPRGEGWHWDRIDVRQQGDGDPLEVIAPEDDGPG